MNFALCPPLGKEPLVDLLTDLGGWELANISATLWDFSDLARDHLASSSALFGFGVSADAKFSSNQTIYVSKHCRRLVVYSPTVHYLSTQCICLLLSSSSSTLMFFELLYISYPFLGHIYCFFFHSSLALHLLLPTFTPSPLHSTSSDSKQSNMLNRPHHKSAHTYRTTP